MRPFSAIKLASFALGFWGSVQGEAAANEAGLAQLAQSGKFRIQIAQQRVDSLKNALLDRFYPMHSDSMDSDLGRYFSWFKISAATHEAQVALSPALRLGAPERWQLLIVPSVGAQFQRTKRRGPRRFGRLRIVFKGHLLDQNRNWASLDFSMRTNIATAGDNGVSPVRGDLWSLLVAAKTFDRLSFKARSTYRMRSNLTAERRYVVVHTELKGVLSGVYRLKGQSELFAQLAGIARRVQQDTKEQNPRLVGTIGAAFSPHSQIICNAAIRYRSDYTYLLEPGITIRF